MEPDNAQQSPVTIPLLTYLWVVILSAWGGIVSYRAKLLKNPDRHWSIAEAIGEMAVAAFAGMLVFFICEYLATPQILTAALVGIAGHMGGRALDILESWAKEYFNRRKP